MCVTPIDKHPRTLLLKDTFGTEFSTRLRDARLQFHNCDILDSDYIKEYTCKVDKLVCRNTLQQIDDKDQVLRNFYSILKPGGQAGILFCLANPVGTWQQTMASMEKWTPYLRSGVWPHFITGNMGTDYYKNLLEEIGFQEVRSERKDVPLSFSDYRSCLRELLPIGRSRLNIPDERMDEFKRDSLQVFKSLIGWREGPMNYIASEVSLFAVKPLESKDSD
ncbi:uncharacterized protein NPIL_197751 [Nephila pilipes]|uniref:Methyltransferase domain-containing protein n=1 Tax=Nephila pilipes TaxID=299642 RepID=A0A8X6QC51_NEPPI|nr:uncharacterized protein NPIL_197751 [Nephila pilipes]